jgi:hypothetical protein
MPEAILKSSKPANYYSIVNVLYFREEFISYQTIKTQKFILINY